MKKIMKAQSGKKLPKAGEQTPSDFYPKPYDKYPRTPGGGANYPEPNGKRGVGPAAKKPKMKMGGTVKKAQDGSAFAKLAPPFDKATYADKIAGATKNKAKSGAKVKKAQMGTEMMQSPMMKKGGSVKKCKYGCK